MTDISNHSRAELAHRSSGGLEVTLFWVHDDDEETTVVCVCDKREGAYFEIQTQPSAALEVFYHPFAYRDFSIVDYVDWRLAAAVMVDLGPYRRRRDAELAHDALNAAGIRAVLTTADAGPSFFTGEAHVLVDEADAVEANAILSKFIFVTRLRRR